MAAVQPQPLSYMHMSGRSTEVGQVIPDYLVSGTVMHPCNDIHSILDQQDHYKSLIQTIGC